MIQTVRILDGICVAQGTIFVSIIHIFQLMFILTIQRAMVSRGIIIVVIDDATSYTICVVTMKLVVITIRIVLEDLCVTLP